MAENVPKELPEQQRRVERQTHPLCHQGTSFGLKVRKNPTRRRAAVHLASPAPGRRPDQREASTETNGCQPPLHVPPDGPFW